jgi:hypothetical protein
LQKFQYTASYIDYIPAIRYAEVLLNYAEAAARQGDTPKALALLNIVRHRSNPLWNFSEPEVGTKEALINRILDERRAELLGEGFRVLDLIRLLKPLPAKGTASAVEPTAYNYIWPIPSNEKVTNSLVEEIEP